MGIIIEIIITLIILAVVFVLYLKRVEKQRERFILTYEFPQRVKSKLKSTYPHLNDTHVEQVIRALKEYFIICNVAQKRMVSMPSQAVDLVWHEFILFTRIYEDFCRQGFGKYLHHTPAEAMKTPTLAQDGIKRAWRLSCVRESINLKSPERLPLLFAIDAELNIPDGFRYALDCSRSPDGSTYCASNIGCGGGCGGDGDGDGGGGCGGGD